MFDIKENLKTLPDKPGVYLHKNSYGEIIYVGKAASLKNRVRQYFQSSRNMDAKVRAMVSHIAEFEYITTSTEMEALILENNLIKKYMPPYNVLLRDDKTYPYIKITMRDEFPRLLKTRILTNDGSKYYGPYADVRSANQIIDLLADIFKLKRCQAVKFPPSWRPCLHGHLGRCRAVCMGDVSRDDYAKSIQDVNAFLAGKSKDVEAYLKTRMDEAAERMDFESAAMWRDYIRAAHSVIEKQRVVLLSAGDIDIILSAQGERTAHVVVFFVREGKLSGRESHHLEARAEESAAEIVSAFIKQYYAGVAVIPKEILLDEELPDMELLAEWLSKTRGSNVDIHLPQRGDKRALLELAKKDVAGMVSLLDAKAKNQQEKDAALAKAMSEIIGRPLDGALRIEAYDISNTGGEDSVGAMVVYEGSRPQKKDYRRFKIRTVEGADDYASTQETLYRRLKRALDGDPGFSKLPNLILLDGGLGHVNAAAQVLQALKLDIPLAGMVKDDKHRTRGLIYGGKEVELRQKPAVYHYIGAIQEEVHRFAIDYHKSLRNKAQVRSELDDIEGIGPKRRSALFAHFGSLDKIKAATEEELAALPGMNAKAARRVAEHFGGSEKNGCEN